MTRKTAVRNDQKSQRPHPSGWVSQHIGMWSIFIAIFCKYQQSVQHAKGIPKRSTLALHIHTRKHHTGKSHAWIIHIWKILHKEILKKVIIKERSTKRMKYQSNQS